MAIKKVSNNSNVIENQQVAYWHPNGLIPDVQQIQIFEKQKSNFENHIKQNQ
ncbi:MAG: hypothetical protein JST58_17045 [Bacteroidetes bacterium]|nr:hypothetical protein [Bacteroidota bacterium]